MTVPFIGPEVEPRLDWLALSDAIEAAHRMPRAEVGDTFLYRGADTLLTRSAWVDGLGIAVKAATIYPGNAPEPTVNGALTLYDDARGLIEAVVDFHLVTKWKTAGDSLLAARKLARKESRDILIVGAGTVAASMTQAYRAAFPESLFTIWSRTRASAVALADQVEAEVAEDLERAAGRADIICTATMTKEPILKGAWLAAGTHVDLIGAFRPDMREADNAAMARARVFVDARATTIGHIGELIAPIAEGAITEADVLGDFYDIEGGGFARTSDDEITLCKNGGGAHLDLMTGRYILDAVRSP